MKLEIVIYTNCGAMQTNDDMADILRQVANQVEQLPAGGLTSPLYDRQMVRVGHLALIDAIIH